jgi:hypothetical protein
MIWHAITEWFRRQREAERRHQERVDEALREGLTPEEAGARAAAAELLRWAEETAKAEGIELKKPRECKPGENGPAESLMEKLFLNGPIRNDPPSRFPSGNWSIAGPDHPVYKRGVSIVSVPDPDIVTHARAKALDRTATASSQAAHRAEVVRGYRQPDQGEGVPPCYAKCSVCGWEGPSRDSMSEATQDALAHARGRA